MKTEKHDVFGFVKIIKQHPELYDKTLEGYARAGGSDTIWSKVVAQVKERLNQDMTVDEAKTKWRGIRSSYARYKKILREQRMQGNVKVIKYYLYDALAFLEPFSKNAGDTSFQDHNSEDLDDTSYALSDYDVDENYEEEMQFDAKNVHLIPDNEATFVECPSSSRIHKDDYALSNNRLIEVEDRDVKKRNKRRRNEDDNLDNFVDVDQNVHPESQDLDFFKSIIPDIKCFTPKQKRKFKVKILQLIDEIEDDVEDS